MKNVTPHKTYSVLALDDHPVVLEGLKHLLTALHGDIACEGVTTSAALHRQLEEGRCFDLFILDLELPDGDGFAEIATIRRHCPHAAILIYTMHEEPWVVARLAQLDIQGIVSKGSPVGTLAEAVATIRNGGTFYNETFLKQMQEKLTAATIETPEFSTREREVLQGICQGLTTKQIADSMYRSTNTVGTYRRRLMSKLGVHNVAQLIAKAQQFLQPPLGGKGLSD